MFLKLKSDAVDVTKKAVKASEADGDEEGAVNSLVNLYEAHRYAGETEEAIKVSNQLAAYLTKLGSPSAAKNYEKQEAILKKGEPLNRVVAVIDGVHYELNGASARLRNQKIAIFSPQPQL